MDIMISCKLPILPSKWLFNKIPVTTATSGHCYRVNDILFIQGRSHRIRIIKPSKEIRVAEGLTASNMYLSSENIGPSLE